MFTLKRTLAPVLAATVLGGSALVGGASPAAAIDLFPTPTPVPAPAPAPAPAPSPAPAERPTTDRFQVATFNVLGASHRAARSGSARIKGTVRYLKKHKVQVVGFQELEKAQYAAFRRQTGKKWTVVGAPTRSGKSTDTRNAIAFRSSRFALESASSLAIPYFHGKQVNIPVVTLRSRTTGEEFTMINTHNPADAQGPAQRYRNEATRRQVKLVSKLRKQGRTVFVTGDMNETKTYFCKMTRSGQMRSASGGSTGRTCRPPKNNAIDWIFGSRDVRLTGWTMDKTTKSKGVSDHPIIVSKATLR